MIMRYDTIPEPFEIPFYDHGKNLGQTIKNSSSRRKMNPIKFIFRKTKNIILYRLGLMCPLNSWRIKMHRWRGVHIGNNVYIGQMCNIDNAYPEYVYIEDDVSLAGEVTVMAHANPYVHFKGIVDPKVAPVVVRKGVWVGVKCVLTAGAEIGEYSIVSAGSVVNNTIPPYSIAIGNPAKPTINIERLIKRNISQ